MEDDFSLLQSGNFHSTLKFSFIFHSILSYRRTFRLEGRVVTREDLRSITKVQWPTSSGATGGAKGASAPP